MRERDEPGERGPPPGPEAERGAPLRRGPPEAARYFEHGGEQLYAVTHAALRARRGTLLLCGPVGVERERAYLTLVHWSRLLAAQGFEVLRFDYRGTGESSGEFEGLTSAHWLEDAAVCAARLRALHPGDALVLQGVRLGALLAAELFARGLGDALLLWAPPASAEEFLRETLRHDLIAQRLAGPTPAPRLRAELARRLEEGQSVRVDGYAWSPALWREARRHPLCVPGPDEPRPWTVLHTGAGSEALLERGLAAHLQIVQADTFWCSRSALLVPESRGFFETSLGWLEVQAAELDARVRARPASPFVLPAAARA